MPIANSSHSKETYGRIFECEYEYQGNAAGLISSIPTSLMQLEFANCGYIIIRNLFSKEEIDKILQSVENCEQFFDNNSDSEMANKPKHVSFVSWSSPPKNDLLDLVIRNRKVAELSEILLNRGEVYLYNARVFLKPAMVGKEILWHQDIRCFTDDKCIYPDLINCYVALTKNDQENGGLKVIKCSQWCGQTEHVIVGGSATVNPEIRERLERKLGVKEVNLRPGDAIIMHVMLMHTSGKNNSPHRRWALSVKFNTKFNSPDNPKENAKYTEKLDFVPVDALEKCSDLTLDVRKRYG